jgi:hypothetical protein
MCWSESRRFFTNLEILEIDFIFEFEDDFESHFFTNSSNRGEEFLISFIDSREKCTDPESENIYCRFSAYSANLEETLEYFFFFAILEAKKRLRNLSDVMMEGQSYFLADSTSCECNRRDKDLESETGTIDEYRYSTVFDRKSGSGEI